MITLPLTFKRGRLEYHQIKRDGDKAIYQVINPHYEVFKIKEMKEHTWPNGNTTPDHEISPSDCEWGINGFSFTSLEEAEEKFNNMVAGIIEDKSVKVNGPIVIPTEEFSIGDFADKNNIDYSNAFVIVKKALENGSIKFIREERRNARGKMTKIYASV